MSTRAMPWQITDGHLIECWMALTQFRTNSKNEQWSKLLCFTVLSACLRIPSLHPSYACSSSARKHDPTHDLISDLIRKLLENKAPA